MRTKLDTTIYRLAYRYSFVTDDRTAIALSFGLHWMSLGFDIAGLSASLDEDFDAEAPLPLVGFHIMYALSPRWTLPFDQEILRFDLGEYRGLVSDTRLTLEHDTFEHFGWGIGYNGFQLDGHFAGSQDRALDIEYGYHGLMLYLRTYF